MSVSSQIKNQEKRNVKQKIEQDIKFNPFFMLFWKEIRRFIKVAIQTILTPVINTVLYLVIFGVSLGESIDTGFSTPYLAFLISGLIMMSCLNNSFQNTASSIVSGKFSGDLEDLKVVPLSREQIIWALSFGGLVRGLIISAVNLVVGEIFYYTTYGEFLPIYSFFWLLFFLVLGALVYATIGIFVAFLAKTFDQMSAVTSFILQPLAYLGGVFFSLNNLSPFWQSVSKYNPVLYLINGVRYSMTGEADVSLLSCVAVTVLSLVLFHFVVLVQLKNSQFKRW